MAQEIEIEYKVLLTKEEYDHIILELPFPTNSTVQTNHYFETENFDLKNKQSALRIRKKNNTYTLTLKQPHKEGILETHDKVTEEEFFSWIRGKPVPKPHVGNQLREMGIDEDQLIYYGSLETNRKSFTSDEVIYVLDKSFYNGKIDYELEIEAPSKEIGSAIFSELLECFQISPKKPITKIERFFHTL